jgi:enoyl-CoA hydratase
MDPASANALMERSSRSIATRVAVAVLWGEGGAFCTGWDLKYGASLVGAEARSTDRLSTR